MPMTDEEWAASKAKQRALQETAKNPPDRMTVFRMQGGDPSGSVGIHWTTDPNVAHHTGLGGRDTERFVHRGIVSRDQVMTEGQWVGNNIRSFTRDPNGGITPAKSQWGLPMEAEVRLRPGSTVSEHAIAPAGVHEYTPTGREPTVEARGHRDYIDLAHQAVQGTPEAERLHNIQGALPHVQQPLFDDVMHINTDEILGHVPNFDLRKRGDFHKALEENMADVDAVARSRGLDPDEGHVWVQKMPSPFLSELRPRPRQQEFKAGHKQEESLF